MSERLRPLQKDMFTGDWVDNRTKRQKKRDAVREKPKQTLMFSQRELAQFGVNPRPRFSLSPHTTLRLLYPDYRTPEDIARDREREIQAKSTPMFDTETDTGPDDELQASDGESPASASVKKAP